ncbi:hypothetical protein JCM11641_003619 [Rhodosporidiobolus odoratus]
MHTSLLTLALAASSALAVPIKVKRADGNSTDIDPTVLNYALTLEHLEAAFYKTALDSYDAAAFESAGYPWWVRYRLTEIANHERSHVDLLTGALTAAGADATAACTYDFGLTGPASVLATAQVLEGVGVAAYTGAANLITSPDYLQVAASILAVEARHAAWVRGGAQDQDSFPAAYDTPLGLNEVYSLAAPFITSCPESNPALPVKAFPALTASAGPYAAGDKLKLSWADSKDGAYAIFLSGLSQTAATFDSEGQVTIPEGVTGQVYVVVSSQNATVSDDTVLAGPAIVEIPVQATTFDY